VTGVAIYGASGRMGRQLLTLTLEDDNLQLAAAIEQSDHPSVGQDAALLVGSGTPSGVTVKADLPAALGDAEVVIDFTTPAATEVLLEHCCDRKLPAVVGTTGLDDATGSVIEALAKVAPVVYAPNFSVGVNVMLALSAAAVQLAGDEFDIEIIEMHHRHKVDAPSGTAVELARVVGEVRGLDPEWASVAGRSGATGPRPREEIGMHALRGGDVVGEHTLMLAGPGERIELTHRATDRAIFARGALRAARWVVGRSPGLYEMSDVLGLVEQRAPR
jgi:4-hydroxy-tetrahydrodipicolinate reductase